MCARDRVDAGRLCLGQFRLSGRGSLFSKASGALLGSHRAFFGNVAHASWTEVLSLPRRDVVFAASLLHRMDDLQDDRRRFALLRRFEPGAAGAGLCVTLDLPRKPVRLWVGARVVLL